MNLTRIGEFPLPGGPVTIKRFDVVYFIIYLLAAHTIQVKI